MEKVKKFYSEQYYKKKETTTFDPHLYPTIIGLIKSLEKKIILKIGYCAGYFLVSFCLFSYILQKTARNFL